MLRGSNISTVFTSKEMRAMQFECHLYIGSGSLWLAGVTVLQVIGSSVLHAHTTLVIRLSETIATPCWHNIQQSTISSVIAQLLCWRTADGMHTLAKSKAKYLSIKQVNMLRGSLVQAHIQGELSREV